MDREFSIFLLGAICLVNGIFSPAAVAIWTFAPAWYPGFLPLTADLSFYLAALLCGLLTLMAGGLVAALFERLTRRPSTDEKSLLVWCIAAGVLSVPALERLFA